MAQSVSNDALWGKLSEISEQLNRLSTEQKLQILNSEQVEKTPDFSGAKDKIIAEIKQQASLLGTHSDINFGTVNQNIKPLNEDINKILNIVAHIRKHQKGSVELQKTDNAHFKFWFFKVRKSSLVIALLGLLVFILTLFCMKQQNDYALLMNEYYRQSIVIIEMQAKVDSLKNSTKPDVGAKKRSQ